MAVSHVVDTSVLTRLTNPTVRSRLQPLIRQRRAARVRISDLEIGYSARNEAEWDDAMESLSSLELVETEGSHLRRAGQVQRLLAARSQRGRKIPDLLIAAAAEGAGLTVLHYDADYDIISGVTGQMCEWVVPAGSID